jgi:hypothetical protein
VRVGAWLLRSLRVDAADQEPCATRQRGIISIARRVKGGTSAALVEVPVGHQSGLRSIQPAGERKPDLARRSGDTPQPNIIQLTDSDQSNCQQQRSSLRRTGYEARAEESQKARDRTLARGLSRLNRVSRTSVKVQIASSGARYPTCPW